MIAAAACLAVSVFGALFGLASAPPPITAFTNVQQVQQAQDAAIDGSTDPARVVRASSGNYAYPVGPATGDLCKTYPAPAVCGLQGTPLSDAAPGPTQVLTFDGSTWGPSGLPATALGWITALDCDLTAQGGQVFNANQNYTVCGVSVQKQNTLSTNGNNEIDAAALLPGIGLRFDPGNSGGYPGLGGTGTGPNYGLPRLFIPLSPLVPGLDWHTQFRLWVQIAAYTGQTSNTGAGGAVIGVDDDNVQPDAGTLVTGCVLWSGYSGAGNQWIGNSLSTYCMFRSENGGPNSANRNAIADLDAGANGYNGEVIEVDSIGNLDSHGAVAVVSGSWPANSATQRVTMWEFGGGSFSSPGSGHAIPNPPSTYGAFVGAAADGISVSNSVSVTYSRIRIDYRL